MKRFLIKWLGIHGKAHVRAEKALTEALWGMGL